MWCSGSTFGLTPKRHRFESNHPIFVDIFYYLNYGVNEESILPHITQAHMAYTRKQQELIGSFQYKVEQLGGLVKGKGIYRAIEAAGIIRDLLLSDNNGLYCVILKEMPEMKNRRNRNVRFEVQFLGSTYHSLLEEHLVVAEAPNKSTMCSHKEFSGRYKFNRHDFLALPILCTENGHYSFRDLISFTANKLGSRHFDHDSGTEEQMILHEIREKFGFDGFDPVLTPIFGLGSVVYTTCSKLLKKLESLDNTN